MLKHCLSTLCVVFSIPIFAQKQVQEKSDSLPEILVKSAWADDFTPVTFKNYDQKTLQKSDFGQDLPYLLQNTPSVVVTSDAGTGVGYTGFRVRGSDPTRVNVTINGIPYNDAESQQVYWVDMPDIFSSTESIQIQRGVGTSTNGAGAFGASINLNTNALQIEKSAEIKTSIGSFGTRRLTLKGATGVHKGFSIDAKFSKITSDGYIDRAASDLMSYDFGLSWVTKNSSFRFNFIDGHERTYQSWNGLPIQLLATNRAFNSSGTERSGEPYANQVDDYSQSHYQLFYNQVFTDKIKLNVSAFATKGRGFYEEYKANKILADFALGSDTSDLVQRRWLDNWFYGTVWGLNFKNEKIDATLGGGYTIYDGNHFGEVIWTAYKKVVGLPSTFYRQNALKKDFNVYGKINYLINSKSLTYLDLQYRTVNYDFLGKDKNGQDAPQSVSMPFFNPKIGFSYKINAKSNVYTTFGVASREPNRNDFVQSTSESRPKAETLQNLEIGAKYQTKTNYFNANVYLMNYKNQLILTGKINDIGAYNRVNVPKSYRMGLELDGGFSWKKFDVNANVTLSQNKILNFDEYIDNWETGVQEKRFYKTTNIAFSPNVIAAMDCKYSFSKNVSASLLGKYVGKQYIDNSSSEVASLSAYFINDLRLNYNFSLKKIKNIDLIFQLNNIFDQKYSSNAWTYAFKSPSFDPTSSDVYSVKDGNIYRQIGLFPQAGRSFMLSLHLPVHGKK